MDVWTCACLTMRPSVASPSSPPKVITGDIQAQYRNRKEAKHWRLNASVKSDKKCGAFLFTSRNNPPNNLTERTNHRHIRWLFTLRTSEWDGKLAYTKCGDLHSYRNFNHGIKTLAKRQMQVKIGFAKWNKFGKLVTCQLAGNFRDAKNKQWSKTEWMIISNKSFFKHHTQCAV